MNQPYKDREESFLRLKNYYLQLHITVEYESEFIARLKSKRALELYRNEILDNINKERRNLGFLI